MSTSYDLGAVVGRGITSIIRTAGTGQAGSVDTYTITYSDATTSTFTVNNGTPMTVDAAPTADSANPVSSGGAYTALAARATLDANSKVTPAQASARIVSVTADKTLALADAGTLQHCVNATAITVTIPAQTSVALPVGTEIELLRGGAGDVTVVAASGVTLLCKESSYVISDQHTCAALKQVAADSWLLIGNVG